MAMLTETTQPTPRCDECQRRPDDPPKSWPIFTVRIGGATVCAKCLRPVGGRT